MTDAKEKEALALVPPQTSQETTHAEFTSDQKRLATTTAQLALAGHQVHKLESGFLVTRWGMTKVCPDLAALVGFARQIGVQA